MFDAEDKSDTQSIADSNMDHSIISASEEPEEQESMKTPSISDSASVSNIKSKI